MAPTISAALGSERIESSCPEKTIEDRNQSTVVNPAEDASWNNRLSAFADATPFHTANWCSVLAEAYGFEPCYFLFEGPRPALLPMFQISSWLTGRRGVSLPFTDFCAPLVNPCSSVSSVVEQLRSTAIQLGREKHWKYLELRGGEALRSTAIEDRRSNDCKPSGRSTINNQPSTAATAAPQFVSHELDLRPGEATLWRGLDSACQRAIRKARAAGVTVRKSDVSSPRSTRDLRAFYDLQCRTRRKHGLPPQPYRFFELIQRHMLEAGLGSLYLAETGTVADCKVADCNVADRKVVAGALYLHFGKSVIFKYGASDERHLDLRANNLVMWQAIADYAAAGFHNLNFGRTEVYNSGLRRYKMAFGTRENTLNYVRFDYATDSFVRPTGSGTLFRLAQSIFRTLPLSAARCLGTALYPHVA